MSFFLEVLVGGLLAGVMYSLVALGFVLIYKASGVFNFAQGALVLFAALTFVSLQAMGLPFWGSLLATLVIMVGMGIAIERVVLRPLVNQPPITLFMATIGLSFFIEGLAQLVWGTEVHGLELGITDEPFEVAGVFISRFDLFAAGLSALLVAVLALGLNTSAFQAEIYRGGFNSIPVGQIEAAKALGLSRARILTRIQLPQVLSLTGPELVNEFIILFKNSSLISVIGVTELMRRSEQLVSTTYKPVEVYLAAAIIYLALCLIISRLGERLKGKH